MGVEGQPDENAREVHFLSGQTSKENEDLFTLFVDASSHAVSGTFSVNKPGNQINVNLTNNATTS